MNKVYNTRETFGHKAFVNLEKAKIAAFNGMEYLKRKG